MSNQILEEFNAECISRFFFFFELIFDKESILYSDESK